MTFISVELVEFLGRLSVILAFCGIFAFWLGIALCDESLDDSAGWKTIVFVTSWWIPILVLSLKRITIWLITGQ